VGLVEGRSRAFVVATFLAVLEMVQRRVLRILPGTAPDDFRLAIVEPQRVHDSLLEAVGSTDESVLDSAPPPDGESSPRPRPAGDRPAIRALTPLRPPDA
jgi:hypothetical protein